MYIVSVLLRRIGLHETRISAPNSINFELSGTKYERIHFLGSFCGWFQNCIDKYIYLVRILVFLSYFILGISTLIYALLKTHAWTLASIRSKLQALLKTVGAVYNVWYSIVKTKTLYKDPVTNDHMHIAECSITLLIDNK